MKFIVEIKYPKYKNNYFQSILPDQQKQIAGLMEEGVIDVFTLNMEQTKVWFVMTADDQGELKEVLDGFITKRFMLKVKIEPLMVYDSRAFQLPPLMMN